MRALRPAGRLLLCGFLLAPGALLQAQQYSYSEYGFEHGLKNAAVNALVQDGAGFLWVGTMSGLYRGDGLEFRGFSEADGLPSATIQSIVVDREKRLWVATRYGVAEARGDRFVELKLGRRTEIYGRSALACGRSGEIYVATAQGLYVVETEAGRRKSRLLAGAGRPVDAVSVDSSGTVWASAGKRLLQVRGNSLEEPAGAKELPSSRWDAMLETPNHDLWVRSSDHLAVRKAGESRFRLEDEGLPTSGFFGSLTLDGEGKLLVPTDRGLALRVGRGWQRIGVGQGLPSDAVSCALYDREGSLWLGLWGIGVARLIGYGAVESYTVLSGLPSSTVSAVRRDRRGRLWMGTDGGVSRMDAKGKAWRTWQKSDGLGGDKLRALEETADGSIWVGSYPGGVTRLALGERVGRAFGPQNGMALDHVNGLLVDERDRLWIATTEGLFRTEPHPGDGARIDKVAVPGAPGREAYFRMAKGPGGELWIASSGGLLHFDKNERWHRYGRAEGLLDAGLTHVAAPPDGSVWVAYRNPLGLSRLAFGQGGNAASATHFRSQLASDTLLLVRTDQAGRLWVGSDDGLDIYDGREWKRFTQANGLLSNSCAVNAFFAESEGPIWIGTARGLTRILNPRMALQRARPQPAAILTAVAVGEQDLSPERLNEATLEYGRPLALQLGALTFRDRRSVQFHYRLLGHYDAWVQTREKEVRYPRLEPGEYVFETYASLPGTSQKSPVTRVGFRVRPPYWMAWWFRIVVGAAAVGMLGLLWYWRVRSLLAHQQALEEAVGERTRELQIEQARVAEEKDRAVKANRYKSEFLARMSHEIRTPIHGVIGMTDLLLLTKLDQKQREMLHVVQESAELLTHLLNDALDLSRVEAGRLVLENAEFDVRTVVLTVVELSRPTAQKKGLKLAARMPEGVLRYSGDARKVQQILMNLVSNAVKFTNRGGVEIEVTVGEASAGGGLRIEITDTGVGIAPEELDQAFQPFVQLEAARGVGQAGSGLGLAICKALTDAMGGSIEVRSKLGEGSTFTVRLPLTPADSQEAEAGSEAGDARLQCCTNRSLRVLVAEDNAINQRIILKMVEALGHLAEVVSDGEQAVAAAGQGQYDVVLMDCQMPEMDGLEATRAIRERLTGEELPIIGLSANVFESDKLACLNAGMNEFLGKPLHLADLKRCLEQVGHRRGREPGAIEVRPE